MRWTEVVGLTVGDRYPVISPFSHISGHKTGLLACLVSGAAALPVSNFNPERFEALAADHGVTVIQGPPTLFHALIERARGGHARIRIFAGRGHRSRCHPADPGSGDVRGTRTEFGSDIVRTDRDHRSLHHDPPRRPRRCGG